MEKNFVCGAWGIGRNVGDGGGGGLERFTFLSKAKITVGKP